MPRWPPASATSSSPTRSSRLRTSRWRSRPSSPQRGALLERCFTTPYTGKVPWQHVFDGVRATGVENNVLSTDLGQVFNPPVEDGLALFADQFLDAGFTEEEVRTMTVANTRRLAGDDPGEPSLPVIGAHSADFVGAPGVRTVYEAGRSRRLRRRRSATRRCPAVGPPDPHARWSAPRTTISWSHAVMAEACTRRGARADDARAASGGAGRRPARHSGTGPPVRPRS